MILKNLNPAFLFLLLCVTVLSCSQEKDRENIGYLRKGFLNPPDSVKPGVYWYFMDGNLSREGMTKDLESMKKAGIANVLFLEVNVGIPRGKVDFLSGEWQSLFTHAVRECERLGITMTLGVGPGWTGSGGPWVTGKQSMQHLVSSSVQVRGGKNEKMILPVPQPKRPFFGENTLTPELKQKWMDFYEDVAVLAFPTPSSDGLIQDIDEKALYYRAPYTSQKGVKQFLPSPAEYPAGSEKSVIKQSQMLDLTKQLNPDGSLTVEFPSGNWTIMRFGVRNNGAVTRPAPTPGLGFECDKFDTTALNAHLDQFTGKLLQQIGIPDKKSPGGLKMLHMDSWEMGAQNWSPLFRDEFKKRRGYDPLPFFPVYAGFVVESPEMSERFLWDLRQTGQELVIENHALQLKKYGQKYNLGLSIEPYDMNPTADMELGSVADVAMCEFWSKDYGFNSAFSCIQAASIAHVSGIRVVAAEAFTAHRDAWKQFPGSMKDQGDWAFAAGVNRFVYHTFQHQLPDDNLKPGITMGPYGVHWDRSQTWWPLAYGYHNYVSRCQYILQQGRTVADVLYLTPEGAPHVFRAPASAMEGPEMLPDRKGYNFDGCSPGQLLTAKVKDKKVVFPGGASYHLLVLPAWKTMTPRLLKKIEALLMDGATIIGNPPVKSPGLTNYPACDSLINSMALKMWKGFEPPEKVTEQNYGSGRILWGGNLSKPDSSELYPDYEATSAILREMNVPVDFASGGPIRYTHRTTADAEIYFVSNRTDQIIHTDCKFRTEEGIPELWDPITGETRLLPEFSKGDMQGVIPLKFEPEQSYFVVFNKSGKNIASNRTGTKNFSEKEAIAEIEGPWKVSYDPKWGGPESVTFDKLQDWTERPEEGIRFYSGIAIYRKSFTLPDQISRKGKTRLFLDLGEVKNMARIRLNDKETGVLWTYPWQIEITENLKKGENKLEIEVANLWPNRLIGDENKPDDGVKDRKWPDWFLEGKPRTSGRYTFTTGRFYKTDSPLLKSGLLGPVRILSEMTTVK